ncbi:MAG: hypothetical protein ACLSFZ_13220 [Frisingicoccus sp.]
MVKILFGQVKQYKKVSLLTPLFTALEVFMEVLIPFVMASIIDKGITSGNIKAVYGYGGLMLVLAFLSLCLAFWQANTVPRHLPVLLQI